MLNKPLPIGVENFEDMITSGYYYADKTMFIKELMDKKSKINLFTRPRRFGKSLALSMLQYFFDITKKDTSHIFNGLNIMSEGDKYAHEMNKYPVISLSLKSAELSKYENSFKSLKNEIIREFTRNNFLLESPEVPENKKVLYNKILYGEADDSYYYESLKFLSECLHAHYKQKVVILIDEYDVPLAMAYFNGYYPQMVDFIRAFFHNGFKTNNALHFAVITGCLRVSRESIFTGFNNPNINSILSIEYGEYFGFTEDEVKDAFKYYKIDEKLQEAHDWYNGYIFGNVNVYNPWSILLYIRDKSNDINWFPRAYWANTSTNSIVRELADLADSKARLDIEALIRKESIIKPISEEVTYSEIKHKIDSLWSFLLFTGYLKKTGEAIKDNQLYLRLEIPNIEVWTIYRDKIMDWFDEKIKDSDLAAMHEAMINVDAETFEDELGILLADSISFHDSHENFYHGFMTGILTGMKGYIVKSNRESGQGRGDVFVMPIMLKKPAVILELKAAKNAADMENDCISALKQIDEKGYADELAQMGYKNIIKYGISFYRKNCMIAK